MQWAPYTGRLVQHLWITLLAAFILSLLLLSLSIHWALLPFCLWMLLVALRIDWDLLDRLAIPPLALLILVPAIGMGIGLPMYVGSLEIGRSAPHLTMQLVFLLGTPILFMGYRLSRSNIPCHWSSTRASTIIDAEAKPLLLVASFLLLFDAIRIAIGWRTGSLDRGFAGDVVLEEGIRLWKVPGILLHWHNLWFFFLPFLWRRSGSVIRFFVVLMVSFYCLLAYASGSRGLLVYPLLFTLCGLYFFIEKPRFRLERWAPLLLVCLGAYIYTLDVFRSSVQFQQSTMVNLTDRLGASKVIAAEARDRQDFAVTTGKALIGVSDDIIYLGTPQEVPYAGGGDLLPAMAWIWVPQLLKPNKPLLIDGNEIVVAYTGQRFERSASAISLSADLYRRWGWWGVPFGLFLVGLVYGFLVRAVLFIFWDISVTVGVVLIAFIVGMAQIGFYSTVLTTWWIWMYDIPKNVIPLVLFVILVQGGLGHGLIWHGKLIKSQR
jgi:hypothetical protein